MGGSLITFEPGFGGPAGGGGLGPKISKRRRLNFKKRHLYIFLKIHSQLLLFTKIYPVPITSSLHVGG